MIKRARLGVCTLILAACAPSLAEEPPSPDAPAVAPLTEAQEQALLDELALHDVIVIGSTEGEGPRDHLVIEEVLRVPPNVRLSNRVPFQGYSTDSDGRMLYAYSLSEPKVFSLHDLDTMPEVEAMIRRELLGD